MINGTEEYQSNKLKEIIQRSGTKHPSDAFTSNIMKQVHDAAALQQETARKPFITSVRIFSAVGVVTAVAAVVLIMYEYGSMQWLQDIKPVFSPVISDLMLSFSQMFTAINLSSTTLVILSGTALLPAVEYFLRKLRASRNSFLTV